LIPYNFVLTEFFFRDDIPDGATKSEHDMICQMKYFKELGDSRQKKMEIRVADDAGEIVP
jgi:hypothetical protein